MAILKSNKKDKGIFLGVHIPPEKSHFLSLYVKANGLSKTSVVNDLMATWMDEKRTKKQLRLLRIKTARRIYSVWEESLDKHNKGRKKYKDFDDFCANVVLELIDKGVHPDDSEAIIEIVKKKDGNKKGKKTKKKKSK